MGKQTVLNKIEGVVTNTTQQDFELPLDLGKGIICYDGIVGVDYTSSPTILSLGFKYGKGEFLLYGEGSPTAQKPVCTPRRVYIPSYYRAFVRVRGASAGDKVALFLYGFYNDEPYPLLAVRVEQ